MKYRLAAMTALTMVGGGLLASPAVAATTTVCADGCDYTTIQAAVDAALDGDVIEVRGELTVNGTTKVSRDVSVVGTAGATVTQTANAPTFLLSADGATLSGLTITSDKAYAREFVQIGGDDVTLSGNTIYGPPQAAPMSGWVSNRGFVTQGNIAGFSATDNVIYSLRSGAYLNPNGTGTIAGNTLYDTKGDFLVDNANFTFTDNEAGDPTKPSEWGFVVFAATAADRYTDLAGLSRANNFMTAWDQRDGEQVVDRDGDGHSDSSDVFPDDASEWTDRDGDGVGDNGDVFPDDASESSDRDGDGVGDNGDVFPDDASEWSDRDGDGVGDNGDVFPDDASESSDRDGDGVGDNGDVFPDDASESSDRDGDGVGDNGDVFADDASEWSDRDGDGVGDNGDVFPDDASESSDRDGDGLGDRADTNTKDDCKDGGYQRFTSPTFKNQGQCVAAHAGRRN
jgi:hypothetical protein